MKILSRLGLGSPGYGALRADTKRALEAAVKTMNAAGPIRDNVNEQLQMPDRGRRPRSLEPTAQTVEVFAQEMRRAGCNADKGRTIAVNMDSERLVNTVQNINDAGIVRIRKLVNERFLPGAPVAKRAARAKADTARLPVSAKEAGQEPAQVIEIKEAKEEEQHGQEQRSSSARPTHSKQQTRRKRTATKAKRGVISEDELADASSAASEVSDVSDQSDGKRRSRPRASKRGGDDGKDEKVNQGPRKRKGGSGSKSKRRRKAPDGDDDEEESK